MGPGNESRAVSETRIATALGDKARVEFALNQAESHVARMGPSPTRRRLGLALEVVRRTVDSWSTRAPTEDQLRLLLQHVLDLRDQTRDEVPTVRFRRSA